MSERLQKTRRQIQLLLCGLVFVVFAQRAIAQESGATLDAATVNRLINDVKVYAPRQKARAAKQGDTISGQTSLQTGQRSRAEMLFQDTSVTRVGANSIFTYSQGKRDVQLKRGTILMCVPKRKGTTRIQTATVTAAITGTTLLMEYQPNKVVKLIVLEGSVTLARNAAPGAGVVVPAGHMIVMNPNAVVIPQPFEIDVKLVRDSAQLLDRQEFPELPRANRRAISKVIAIQRRKLRGRDEAGIDARFRDRALLGLRPVGPATAVDTLP